MKAIYKEDKSLDEKAMNYGLSEDVLLENAGIALALLIKKEARKKQKQTGKKSRILFLLGGGNNGADGLVALRHLKRCKAYKLGFNENANFKKQERILKNYGFKFLQKKPRFQNYDFIIDCILGTGIQRNLEESTVEILHKVNRSDAIKIACDIPTALGQKLCFKADITLCMGVYKELVLQDFAKDYVGKLYLANLGIKHKYFACDAKTFLLEKKDLQTLQRKQNSHKGTFGHIYIAGSASAGTLAGLGALHFGAGLVSLVAPQSFSPLLMLKKDLSSQANAIALGMGLENLELLQSEILKNIPLVLDANCFLSKNILLYLDREDVVITPHPKEFLRLWRLCFNETLTIDQLQKERFFYAREFTKQYQCILVLKGANTLIAYKDKIFVVNLGNSALAKGGSGDVLSGMIATLLAAGFKACKAAKNAVLAHALVAKNYKANPNSFTALKLVKGLQCL
ncbi:NAD(P)H-hydrate dehydratase [Campylobacter sp. MIT 21-1685]|uniref:NAD(P)H-hydrate dehydratase n=1 Tax=unclassified Campylobacter TaxID=2593542 RepID=UPI00224B72AE|nr:MULTISPECIES: NAD(P)H-hydrate dehydratase [unclassified Campylobacter]MCX2683549.1 NAD(P)H-hydrate dehydratase [Campylobacter sp. MIT 21-1684]MCX2751856.1 NAD(P)H-hydrate dehydratase [Campylobacter sp. MIT 21-1682]MCX2808033.1 NAD(P)H-hydrate dehydratase [Campylobacter sp. MIT 21-1685]